MADMTRPQIIRAAYRRADARLADMAHAARTLARRMGCVLVPDRGRMQAYRRAEARRALGAAGVVATCKGVHE